VDLFSIGIGGMNVVYAAAGTSANPPLVFVHGWAISHRFWRLTLPEFQLHYRCTAIDLPGFGLSDKPKIRYDIPSLAEYLGRFLDALNIPVCDLVGHSMGGLTSLTFALAHPERVNRLCVVNPPMRGPDALMPLPRLGVRPVIRWLSYWGCQIPFLRRWVAKDISYVVPIPDDLLEDVSRATYRSLTQTVRSIRETDVTPRLPELRMPALLIGCDRDRVIRPEQHLLWPKGENFRYVCMKETGHFPMTERPAEFNQILIDFLGIRF
jgi:pimeloyl-ACP methyl ester carboxylesterase